MVVFKIIKHFVLLNCLAAQKMLYIFYLLFISDWLTSSNLSFLSVTIEFVMCVSSPIFENMQKFYRATMAIYDGF